MLLLPILFLARGTTIARGEKKYTSGSFQSKKQLRALYSAGLTHTARLQAEHLLMAWLDDDDDDDGPTV